MDQIENTQMTESSPAPAVAPAQAPETPVGNASGLDLNALNQAFAPLGRYNFSSVDDVVKAFTGTQTAMREAQEKAAKHEQRTRRLEPLLNEAETNQDFQRYLYEKANEYANPVGNALDPSVASVLNPVLTQVDDIRLRLAERDMKDQMDSLARDPDYGSYMTDDVKRELLINARATGDYDLEKHFNKLYGRRVIQDAKASAKQEVVREITEKNNAYPHGSAPSAGAAVAPQVNPLDMTPKEKEAFIQREAERILRDPAYRDKVNAGG